MAATIDYDGVLKCSETGSAMIIDVRGRNELIETGRIPGAVNIPLSELENGVLMPADEFKKTFGADKPDLDRHIICHCKAGGRAQKAVDCLIKHGYKQTSCYKGSMNEWLGRGGAVHK